MVKLVDIDICTGCEACKNACPHQSITMEYDREGFLQPVVGNTCIDCEICRETCPQEDRSQKRLNLPKRVYAATMHDTKALSHSSSGGAFVCLAREVLTCGGVVYGAAYTSANSVAHIAVCSEEQINGLQGSKYVQSEIGDVYQSVKENLAKNMAVLFSGTPCQVSGLKAFLKHDYAQLYTVDVICHGVPSPGVFREYIKYLEHQYGMPVTRYEFRSKINKWRAIFTTEIHFSDGRRKVRMDSAKEPYMHAFLTNLILRKSCYHCQYASTERVSDITLGDFWRIGETAPYAHPTDKGVSLILVNSDKGKSLFDKVCDQMLYEERTLEEAINGQNMLRMQYPHNALREAFFQKYGSTDFSKLVRKFMKQRINAKSIAYRIVYHLFGEKHAECMKKRIREWMHNKHYSL